MSAPARSDPRRHADTFTTDLVGCARCGADGHRDLTFTKLGFPVDLGSIILTHWAVCPANGEPILMRFMALPMRTTRDA